jgi:hypothetical protein
MRTISVVIACCALPGLWVVAPAMAQQKTVKACPGRMAGRQGSRSGEGNQRDGVCGPVPRT